jgi:putative hydrolase of the HAD superfamily
MPIRAVIVDVEGVQVDGRPEDGRHWSFRLEDDLGLSKELLQPELFQIHWEDGVLGRFPLVERLALVLKRVSSKMTADQVTAH